MAEQNSVYIDACCFIDVVKFDVSARLEDGRESEVWYTKKLLQAHRDREVTVYTSAISIAEAVHIGASPVPGNVQSAFEALLTSGQYVYLVQPTPFICTDARNLRWVDQIKLRGVDSIHIASAIDRGCSEFISQDSRLERASANSSVLATKGLVVCTPSETKALPAKYLQKDLLEGQDQH